jgi:hypothetical protein
LNLFNKGIYNAKKNTVHTATLLAFKNMEKLIEINRDSVVIDVLKHIFGKNLTTKNIVSRSGSNYGLVRVIPFDNYVSFQSIANQNYIASKTTGLILYLKKRLIFQDVSIFSMMELIFIKKDVLSV